MEGGMDGGGSQDRGHAGWLVLAPWQLALSKRGILGAAASASHALTASRPTRAAARAQVAPPLPVLPMDPLLKDPNPDDGSMPLVVAVSTAGGLKASARAGGRRRRPGCGPSAARGPRPRALAGALGAALGDGRGAAACGASGSLRAWRDRAGQAFLRCACEC